MRLYGLLVRPQYAHCPSCAHYKRYLILNFGNPENLQYTIWWVNPLWSSWVVSDLCLRSMDVRSPELSYLPSDSRHVRLMCRFKSLLVYVWHSVVCRVLMVTVDSCQRSRAVVRRLYCFKLSICPNPAQLLRTTSSHMWVFSFVVYRASKPQSNFLPVSGSIICPIVIVSYCSRLTEAPVNVVSQVALSLICSCAYSCYPLGGISIIIFLASL